MDITRCSILVCTFNRLEYLKRCIASLLEIDFPEYEVIIVDDGSNDGTKEFLDNIKNDKIKVVHHERNQGICAAKNTGIKHANFDIIACTDDDCTVDRNWLAELLKVLITTKPDSSSAKHFTSTKTIKVIFRSAWSQIKTPNGRAEEISLF